ncbi:MAG: SH3 domain-containing protein [Candidatus Omnitrophica bacterium]|nr:SH3 domain-containing protein [Candidatus Omnitrophota bacterium]
MSRFIVFFSLLIFLFPPLTWSQQEFQAKSSVARASVSSNVNYTEGLAPGEKLPALPAGPLFLTGTMPEQLTADYWINRLPEPDRSLKMPEQLRFFNQEIRSMTRERTDIFEPGILPNGTQIRNIIKMEYETISGRKLFDIEDVYIPKKFFEVAIKPIVDWESVPNKMTLKWGAATRATSVRALPTNVKMLEEKGDIEFDQLQFTLIKLWTPVAILHTSQDGKWYYVQAPYVRGWVKSKYIALFPTRKALREKVQSKKFLVVTGESVSVCSDPACRVEFQRPTMGTILPLIQKNEAGYVVEMPIRAKAGTALLKNYYIQLESDVHIGFPSFTQRNIIRQAFKLLAARYGWGGMYNGRDCSGFTHDVFLSLGMDLPRDSDQQTLIGTQRGYFRLGENAAAKTAILKSATPGITLLKMPMHMMLYLGEVDGRFFVIHSTWAERVSMTSDEKNRINQVVVSDLSLNGRSYLGSLFDRTIGINELD